MSVLTVSCPICAKRVPWQPEAQFKPFCSARCQQHDLGAWASGAYTIPVQPMEDHGELGTEERNDRGLSQ